MRSKSRRFALLGAVIACVALVASLPVLAGAATKSSTVTVAIKPPNEFAFKLSAKTVPVGKVTFKVSNSGQLPHDFELCSSSKGTSKTNACTGKSTPMISPGQTATLVVNVTKAGTYEYLCTVSGHAAYGMKGILTVK
jgi:uncharacterized cupredoxin-like copper-binding protein